MRLFYDTRCLCEEYSPHILGYQSVGNAGLSAQLDARPAGDQEVAGSTPAGWATFFRGDLVMKYFLVILSLLLIQEGQLSVSGKRICTLLVNRLED